MVGYSSLLGSCRPTVLKTNTSAIRYHVCFRYAGSTRFAGSVSGFEYSRLVDGQIRLLKIVENDKKSDLDFAVETYPINNAPAYTALSYAWGENIASRPITLNGVAFPIRSNLWSALYHIKRQLQWHYLWVDAISINQNDTTERSEQVRIMHDIFRGAATVTAWLGPTRSSGLTKENLDMGELSQNETFREISRRPYWSRMWIVQELLVAKEVQLKIGHHNFDFEYLKSLIHADDLTSTANDLTPLFVAPFLQTRDPERFPQQPLPLLDLLFAFKYSKCSDARDKVFSLLALTPQYEQDILRRFFPDYSLTTDEVFVVTLAFLDAVCQPSGKAWSDHVFNSLGVADIPRRNNLLRRSKSFDKTLFAASELAARDRTLSEATESTLPRMYHLFNNSTGVRSSYKSSSRTAVEQSKAMLLALFNVLRHCPRPRAPHVLIVTTTLGAGIVVILYLFQSQH